MKRSGLPTVIAALIAILSVCIPQGVECAGVTLTTPDGDPVVWSDWIADRAPVVVLLWASWVPGADEALGEIDGIRAAARAQGFDLVIVAVQESIGDAADSLGGIDLEWLHDRYGHLLKEFRVVDIPRVVVFSADTKVAVQLDPNSESLRAWGAE